METCRQTVRDIEVKGKFVLMRSGLDVPLDPKLDLLDQKRVKDDTRIRDILPTLEYLIVNKAKIILAAGWCGRPKGIDPNYSMAPVAKRLELLLKERNALIHPVLIAPDCFKDKKPKSVYKNKNEVRKIVSSIKEGQVVVLENVRYDPEANADDMEFAEFFASMAEIYVNENETQNHRKEATIATTPLLIAKKKGKVVYGLKYCEVIKSIGNLKKNLIGGRKGHFVFGLCGKKIESDPGIVSKINVASELIDSMKKGDSIITGGAVSYTFMLARHYEKTMRKNLEKVKSIVSEYNKRILSEASSLKDKEKAAILTDNLQKEKSDKLKSVIGIKDDEIKSIIGNSYIRWGQEGEQIAFAYDVISKAESKGITVLLPIDHVITDSVPDKEGMLPENAKIKVIEEGIPKGWLGVSEGQKTLAVYAKAIESSFMYLQSGPYSIEDNRVEEASGADNATFAAALRCKKNGGTTIGAGGDTVARINSRKAGNSFTIITSAGGATLEIIMDQTSVGMKAVEKAWEISKKALS